LQKFYQLFKAKSQSEKNQSEKATSNDNDKTGNEIILKELTQQKKIKLLLKILLKY